MILDVKGKIAISSKLNLDFTWLKRQSNLGCKLKVLINTGDDLPASWRRLWRSPIAGRVAKKSNHFSSKVTLLPMMMKRPGHGVPPLRSGIASALAYSDFKMCFLVQRTHKLSKWSKVTLLPMHGENVGTLRSSIASACTYLQCSDYKFCVL